MASYRFTDTVAVSRLNILATLSSTPTSSIKTNQLLLNQTANRRMKQDTKKFILKSLVSVTIKIVKVSCSLAQNLTQRNSVDINTNTPTTID